MISFYEWLNEFTASALDITSPKIPRKSTKIAVDSSKFNIIPLKIGYDTNNIFKKYSGNEKFAECNKLLDRRGNSVDWETVFSSNEELANLKELANYIINISKNIDEVRVAHSTLNRIYKLEDNLTAS